MKRNAMMAAFLCLSSASLRLFAQAKKLIRDQPNHFDHSSRRVGAGHPGAKEATEK